MTDAPMQWFRFWHDTVHDKKLRRLTPAQRWLWCACMTAASESPIRGYLLVSEAQGMTDTDLADLAAIPVKVVRETMPIFEQHDMIRWDETLGAWQLGNWTKRQPPSDNSTSRVNKHRSKQRDSNGDETFQERPQSQSQIQSQRSRVSSVDNSRRLAVVPDDDEPVENQAIRLLAERALEKREREVGPVGNRQKWLAKAVNERIERHTGKLKFVSIALSPLAIAEILEPDLFPKPSGPLSFHEHGCVGCGGHGTDRNCTGTEATE